MVIADISFTLVKQCHVWMRWGKIMQSSGFTQPTIEYVRWYFLVV
jgi:hypothetical protein